MFNNATLAILYYNTTCHTSFGCEFSRIFHERVSYNILDCKFGLKIRTVLVPTTDYAVELLRRKQILYAATKQITVIIQVEKF